MESKTNLVGRQPQWHPGTLGFNNEVILLSCFGYMITYNKNIFALNRKYIDMIISTFLGNF
jgi:hypothetical protein